MDTAELDNSGQVAAVNATPLRTPLTRRTALKLAGRTLAVGVLAPPTFAARRPAKKIIVGLCCAYERRWGSRARRFASGVFTFIGLGASAAGPLEFKRSSDAAASNDAGLITAVSDASFKVGSITAGAPVYTDRKHTAVSLPDWLTGAEWLKTPNDYKEKVGDDSLVEFTVTRDVVVHVAFGLPRLPWNWRLASTTHRVQIIGSRKGELRWHHVWAATLPAGDHSLGGVNSGGAYGFSAAPFLLFQAAPDKIRVSASSAYRIEGNTQVGTKLFVDRPYTVVHLPEDLKGTTLLRTAMNHKKKPHATSENLYQFQLEDETEVFVVADAGGIPGWLRDYALLPDDQYITVKISANSEKPESSPRFRLFRKQFAAGTRVLMGYPTDHLGSSTQMYFVAVKDQASEGVRR